MKKIILSMLAAAFGVAAVQAQEIPGRKHDKFKSHENHRVHHPNKGMKGVELSEEQKARFKSLNEEHRQQMADLKKQDHLTVKEYRAKMENLQKSHREKMQSLLTADQKAAIEKNRAARQERFGQRGDARSERMKKELNLSADQAAKMDANRKAMAEKMKAIREDNSLTMEQKKEKSRELMKANKENMKSILTEEQLQKMKERKGPGHGKKVTTK